MLLVGISSEELPACCCEYFASETCENTCTHARCGLLSDIMIMRRLKGHYKTLIGFVFRFSVNRIDTQPTNTDKWPFPAPARNNRAPINWFPFSDFNRVSSPGPAADATFYIFSCSPVRWQKLLCFDLKITYRPWYLLIKSHKNVIIFFLPARPDKFFSASSSSSRCEQKNFSLLSCCSIIDFVNNKLICNFPSFSLYRSARFSTH